MGQERHELDDMPLVGVFAIGITILVLIVWGDFDFRERAHPARGAAARTAHAPARQDRIDPRVRANFWRPTMGSVFSTAISPPTRPQWRLVWSLQAGIVVFAVGAAIFLTGGFFLVGSNFGWMIMGIGIALIVATGASWRVARAFGLVGSARETTSRDTHPSA